MSDYPRPDRLEHYTRLYREFHAAYPKYLVGKLHPTVVAEITALVLNWQRVHRVTPRLLDYGSGKGYQYLADRVHESWGGILPICYDVGVRLLKVRPTGKFDGIICTDVLEHIEERDLGDVVSDVFDYANVDKPQPFVYFNICCRPARKMFDDGSNLHATVKPPEWWQEFLHRFLPPAVSMHATYTFKDT